jgi:hypothetical protein
MFTVIIPWRTTKLALIQVADSTAKHPPAATSTKPGSIDKVILYTKAKCGQMSEMLKKYVRKFDNFLIQQAQGPSWNGKRSGTRMDPERDKAGNPQETKVVASRIICHSSWYHSGVAAEQSCSTSNRH